MRFGETLSTHLTPEWRKQYISYILLKEAIYNAIQNAPDRDRDYYNYKSFAANFEEEFFQECDKELTKIDTFFAEKLAEAKRKFRELYAEVKIVGKRNNSLKTTISNMDLSSYLSKRNTKHLKLAMSEYYLSLVLLQNYQTLNHTGFRKILKKHDKNLRVDTGLRWFKRYVDTAPFATNTEISRLISETETIYINNLERGDRSRAMKRLRVPPFEVLQNPWRTFRIGVAMGALMCLCSYIIIAANDLQMPYTEFVTYIGLHRGPFLLVVMIFLIGVNIYGWQKTGINHVLIFEIDPRDHLTAAHFMEIASNFGVMCALSFLGCLFHTPRFMPPLAFPLILTLIMFLYWIMPLPVQWSARFWLLKVIGRIVAAPFFPVGFADFWLADQLTSLSLAIMDFEFVICFYLTNKDWYKAAELDVHLHNFQVIMKAILLSLPPWWRLAQSLRRYYDTRSKFPFLANACKYATTFPVAGFGAAYAQSYNKYNRVTENPYFWCYVISRLISSIYSLSWDFLMDFGVLRKFSGDNLFLREQILYSPYIYYLAMVENLLLRFFWTFALFVEINGLISSVVIITLSGILEIVRRYIWNYFRLEHEHLNNAGNFRAVRDISVKLVTTDDHKRIQDLMDEPTGITSRRDSRRRTQQQPDSEED